jgi:hypothetical protein
VPGDTDFREGFSIQLLPPCIAESTPTAVLARQVRGAIAKFDKATAVAARDRKIAAGEKWGGRKSYAEARPEVVALVRHLRRPDADRRPTPPWTLSRPKQMMRATHD